MAYYSFKVVAKYPVAMINPLIMVDTGFNVFTAVVDDLPSLLDRLAEDGVEVQEINQLDGLAAVSVTDTLPLPDESFPLLLSAK